MSRPSNASIFSYLRSINANQVEAPRGEDLRFDGEWVELVEFEGDRGILAICGERSRPLFQGAPLNTVLPLRSLRAALESVSLGLIPAEQVQVDESYPRVPAGTVQLSISELRELAAAAGIEVGKRARRAALITALQEAGQL